MTEDRSRSAGQQCPHRPVLREGGEVTHCVDAGVDGNEAADADAIRDCGRPKPQLEQLRPLDVAPLAVRQRGDFPVNRRAHAEGDRFLANRTKFPSLSVRGAS